MMMNKINTICLSCGQVQVRTDFEKEINEKYIVLSKKMCPLCGKNAKQIATKNIKVLRKKLECSNENSLDQHIYGLIQR